MTLISIFGKDVEEARKALKSKLLLSLVLACVFFGERAVGRAADGFQFTQSWVETTLSGDTWAPNLVDQNFMTAKLEEFDAYVASDRTFWLNSGMNAAAWPLAQDVMAAPDAIESDRAAILALFANRKMPNCVCWSETGLRQHMGASAWITTALSVLGGDLRDGALDDILSKQTDSGAWIMFAETSNDPQSSSTYATVTAMMAIVSHRRAGLLEGDRKRQADVALQQGSRWLIRNFSFTEKGWMDYPNNKEGRSLSLGLSAQTLWLLHEIVPGAQLVRIDRTFIERDDLNPQVKDFDISDVAVYFGKDSLDYDNTRYARHPWTLLALQAGYKNYSTQQRVKMRVLMKKALTERSWDDREAEREYMLLELMFAYRVLGGGSGAPQT